MPKELFSPIKGLSPDGWPGPGGEYGAPRDYGGHAGIDVPSTMGQNWYAICDGRIAAIVSSWAEGSGMILLEATQEIDNYPAPLFLGYGGTASINVRVGQEVSGGQLLGNSGTHGSGPHIHFFVATSSSATNGSMDPTSLIKAAVRGQQPSGGPGSGEGDGGSAGGGESGLTTAQMMSLAKASAFVAEFQLPDIMAQNEAIGLQGQRSLLNDTPLMPFIQQLTKGSMRRFQSLPDGTFHAFYPDYFGNMQHRKPYWYINDIEILDMTLEVTDETLATHVFVVGDTVPTQGVTREERWYTTGVVNIINVVQSGFRPQSATIGEGNEGDKRKNTDRPDRRLYKTDQKQVFNFLKKYGARPYYEEAPMIRSGYYEAFMAFHRFQERWASQFKTTVRVTYMPEVFPAGLVAFPQHGLQCFVEEVSHAADYTAGFTTELVLSSPATLNTDKLSDDPLQHGLVRAYAAE